MSKQQTYITSLAEISKERKKGREKERKGKEHSNMHILTYTGERPPQRREGDRPGGGGGRKKKEDTVSTAHNHRD